MSIYIYELVDRITMNWHDGGGVVIVTERDPQAAWSDRLRGIAAAHPSNSDYLDDAKIRQALPEADRIIQTPAGEVEQVFVFQDAGCC